MGLTLNRLLARPKLKQNRRIILTSHIDIKFISKQNDGFIVDFAVPSESDSNHIYSCSIWTNDNQLSNDSLIKVKCDCANFQYQYETVLSQHDALIGTPHSDKLPKNQIIYVCKHLESCLKKLMTYKNLDALIKKNQGKWSDSDVGTKRN